MKPKRALTSTQGIMWRSFAQSKVASFWSRGVWINLISSFNGDQWWVLWIAPGPTFENSYRKRIKAKKVSEFELIPTPTMENFISESKRSVIYIPHNFWALFHFYSDDKLDAQQRQRHELVNREVQSHFVLLENLKAIRGIRASYNLQGYPEAYKLEPFQ
mgnify:CR=1 FL=1|jgi:hypothetical protein